MMSEGRAWRVKLLAVLLGAFQGAARLSAAPACTEAAFEAYVARVQTLDRSAAAVGQQLLGCGTLQERVVQWQAFLLAKTQDQAASLKLDASSALGSGREGVLARARAGYPQELEKKIDDQDPDYATAADAQLVLARVLTRKGQFARGRQAYATYLKLKPDDDEATLESMYSYLWEGDLNGAEAQFAAASRWGGSPAFTAAVKRGQDLVEKLRGNRARAEVSGGAVVPGFLRGDYSLVKTTNVYLRRTEAVDYQGLFDLRFAAHSIQDLALSQDTETGGEMLVGASYEPAPGWRLAAHVGYFTLGDDHYMGDAAASVPLTHGPFGISVFGGGYRQPLALQLPLTSDAIGLMRDGIFAGASVGKYLSGHFELQKEDNGSPHEYHTVLGQLPLRDEPGDRFYVRLPLLYDSHPQPSPDYDTYALVASGGLGLFWNRLFAEGAQVAITADYSLVFLTDREVTERTTEIGFLAATAEFSYAVGTFLEALCTVHYAWADDSSFLRLHNEPSSISIGLGYGERSKMH